jgi:hypothetical protein
MGEELRDELAVGVRCVLVVKFPKHCAELRLPG